MLMFTYCLVMSITWIQSFEGDFVIEDRFDAVVIWNKLQFLQHHVIGF